jgi:DNA-binding FrmR family transcriptional regulator
MINPRLQGAHMKKNKKKDCCAKLYPNHEKELPRLNRIYGQIGGIKKMITQRRYCPEIIQQLCAVRSALKAVETNILKTHLEACVAKSLSGKKDSAEKIAEIKALLDKF